MTPQNVLYNAPTTHPIIPFPVFYDSVAGTLSHFTGSSSVPVPLSVLVSPTANSTVTLTSGTAIQNAASAAATYYVGITGGTAGTVKVEMGPTSACAITAIPAAAGNAVSSYPLPIHVPAGWYVKVTTSVATINANTVVVTQAF